MLWDTSLLVATLQSLLVSFGAATLCVLASLPPAIAIQLFRVPGSRFLASIILSLALVPVYVQATAWSAGFGDQGWLRWNQVVAARAPLYALGACIWIHASTLFPVAFLISSIGIRRTMDRQFELGLFQPHSPFLGTGLQVVRLAPWIAVNWCLCCVLATNDMVVTNLFQVPTLTETIYQQVQFQKIHSPFVATVIVYSACIAALWGILLRMQWNRLVPESSASSTVHLIGGLQRLTWWLLAIATTSIFTLFPALCLIVKSGWSVRDVSGQPVRVWSIDTVARSIGAIHEFSDELYWSLLLSFGSLLCCTIPVLAAITFCHSRHETVFRRRSIFLFSIFAFCFSLPGPIINLLLQKFLVDQNGFLGWLGNDTLAAPVIALQFRLVPILFSITWIAVVRFKRQYSDLLAISQSSFWPHYRALSLPYCTGALICYLIAFSSLETYLLILPPSVTPVAMRLFELLHYGVQNKEAALALVLMAASSMAGYCSVRL